MKGKRTKKVLFIFWTILAILSIVWIVFNILNVNLILTKFTFQFVFVLSCLSFFVSMISIKELFAEVKKILNEEKIKQRNVKDVYLYQQLLEPPDSDMYN